MKGHRSSRPAPCAENSFRLRLQQELAQRCGRNARYSLRALALDLSIDHSTLSQLLRGVRRISRETIERLGTKLGLSAAALEHYAEQEARWSAETAPAANELEELAQEAAAVIAEWQHFALLELVRLEGFQPDSRWIARVLDLSVDEVNVALQRLLRLGLLEMADHGRWIDRCGDAVASLQAFHHTTVQRLFERSSALAAGALERAAPDASCHAALTLAIERARVPEALARIERFRRELAEWLEESARRDDVYRLEIGFFPLTRIHSDQE